MSDWTPCVVETCKPIRDSHLPDCPQAGCRGCAPRLAEKPRLACRACELRAADRLEQIGCRTSYETNAPGLGQRAQHGGIRWLPSLYNAVLTPAKVLSNGGGGRSNDLIADDTQVAEPNSAQANREAIRRMLVTWCKVLQEDYGVFLPADQVPAMARHLLANLHQLLMTEHADQLVHDIDQTWIDAHRCAYPTPPLGQALGDCPDCGTLVRSVQTYGMVTCRGCGTIRDMDEWRAVMLGDLSREASAPAAELIAWLTGIHQRQISRTAFQQWAQETKGAKVPTRDGSGNERIVMRRMGTDERGRATYSVADASRIAAALYGPSRIRA